MAASVANVTPIDPVLLREGIDPQNGGIENGFRLACIASKLTSLRPGEPNTIKIEGFPDTFKMEGLSDTVTFNTFDYTKWNKEKKKHELFKGYSSATEIIGKLAVLRRVLQEKNRKINPIRTSGELCALALLHCRSEPDTLGGLATGCIFSSGLNEEGNPIQSQENTATASDDTRERKNPSEKPREKCLLARGHGKYINIELSRDYSSNNVYFRVKEGKRARKLDRLVDVSYYANWIMCCMRYPLQYYVRKTDDLIKVEHIDMLDMIGVCNHKLDREGSAAHGSKAVSQNYELRRSNTGMVPDPRFEMINNHRIPEADEENQVSRPLKRRPNNRRIPEAAEETPKSINIGGTVKRKRPKRRKRKTRKR